VPAPAPHKKTIHKNLYGCLNADCPIVSFIKSTTCPGCEARGVLLRPSRENEVRIDANRERIRREQREAAARKAVS
jgi:hypothetical protein